MKKTHILAIIVIALAIGAIMTTVSDSSTYSNFSEAIENPGKEYHVVGQLDKESELTYDPEVDANLFAFNMIDNNGDNHRVHFAGSKPQDFEHPDPRIYRLCRAIDRDFRLSGHRLLPAPGRARADGAGARQAETRPAALDC